MGGKITSYKELARSRGPVANGKFYVGGKRKNAKLQRGCS